MRKAFKHSIRLFFVMMLVLVSRQVFAQQKFTVSGVVKDAKSGETIIGALVSEPSTGKGTSTNTYGFFSLGLTEGNHLLEVTFLGFQKETIQLNLNANRQLEIYLKEMVVEEKAVVISAEKTEHTTSTEVGTIHLDMDQVKKLPVLLGEVDILKTISLLPGVQSAGEGNAGFYVRGGGIDQNLILLDNATVYNASHLFGFFSVFNADAIKNLELIKGGVPAQYGTRLSSVLDINLKEGNYKTFHAKGGIGTIASRLTIEGPIKKDTGSFIISVRRTYIDALVRPFIKPTSNFAGTGYYFYDLNAKFNYRLTQRDQIFLSGYFGRDVFGFKSRAAGFSTKIPWGNSTATFRWNRLINDRLFMNAIATFTDYRFSFEGAQDEFTFSLNSGIRDLGTKFQWNYFGFNGHEIRWGTELTHHTFTPNNAKASSQGTEFNLGPQVRLYSLESAAYVSDEFDITTKLRINVGMRFSYFIHLGPFTRYVYPSQNSNIGAAAIPTQVTYTRNQKVAEYFGPEPRMNIRYTLNSRSSIKAGFNRNYQYVHLTSFSPTALPTDVWLPSTDLVRPQIAWQTSAGYFRTFAEGKYEGSFEVYYKDMRNLSEYKEGADPQNTVNNNIDNLLWFGRGYSYGAEFFLKKRRGPVTGWIGYTLARTMRVFEQINDGKPFPSRWDRRHDANIVLTWAINKRIDVGAVFVYGTGNAITLPLQRYFIEGRVVDLYGPRNSFRMAPYHRADLSCTLHGKQEDITTDPSSGEIIEKKKRRFHSDWVFSVYNIYNRKNPYFIYFANDGTLTDGKFQVKAYQVSLFPVLPSITWNFEF